MRVLLVEDQKKTASFLSKGLSAAGYACDWADSISGARDFAAGNEYDAMIVDVNLPDESGISFVREVRNDEYRGVVILLTALSATDFKIQGLDAGADDYITKPFSVEELLARLRAQLRKINGANTTSSLTFLDLKMDLVKRTVRRNNTPIELSVKEFSLLEYFLRNADRPLSRAMIAEHVWNADFDSESNVIDVYINHLRKKMEVNDLKRLIHTVTGVGYILSGPKA